MKSGTNQFHGTGYDVFQNTQLNAGTPFTSDSTGHNIRNALHRNDYGATFGGSVRIPKLYKWHDKTFFFFNFEQFREIINAGIATVRTAAYRQGNRFSAIPVHREPQDPLDRIFPTRAIFDPATTRQAPNGQTVRDPFPATRFQ